MTRDDDATKPLPAAEEPAVVPDTPTEPLIAPHVPVADVGTAQLDAAAVPPAPARRTGRTGLALLLIPVGVLAVVAALALGGGLFRGGAPVVEPSDSPVPTESNPASEDPADQAPADQPPPGEPAPADPGPAPAPEPPAPTEPPVEPTEPPVEPTPQPTP